jgi:hypothetical protein
MDIIEYTSNVLGILEFMGILDPIKNMLYFMLAGSGTFALVRFLKGG